jgi:serine/threonine protein kinase
MYNSAETFAVISMEDLTAQKTLYQMCSNDNNLTSKQALLIAHNCARAVAELHMLGVVHGDLAKENILIDPQTYDVKIIDFDLAS